MIANRDLRGIGAMLLSPMLRHLVRRGTLRVIGPDGSVHVFTGEPGPVITIRFHDKSVERQLLFNSRLHLGETYMDGRLTIEDASLYDFLDFMGHNLRLAPRSVFTPLLEGF